MKKHGIAFFIVTLSAALSLGAFVGCGGEADNGGAPSDGDKPAVEAVKLDAPVIELNDNIVEWDTVSHAVGYLVYVGSDAAVTVTDTEYNIDKTEAGKYEIYVVAKAGGGGEYADSAASNKVEYEVFAPDEAALTKLMLVKNPDKLEYFLDETMAGGTLDLKGLSVNAKYSNGAVKKVSATYDAPDLTTLGDKTITLSYKEGERTVTTTIVVTVKKRTEGDITDVTDVIHEYTGPGRYKLCDGSVAVVDMDGNAVAVDTSGGVTSVLMDHSGSMLLKATDGDGASRFIRIAAAKYISTAEQLKAVANDLSAYYMLRNDISLNGSPFKIGCAPLKKVDGVGFDDERAYNYDEDGTETAAAAFTGTFDGAGYVISGINNSVGEDSYNTADAYYMGMFGYIGETGRVCNLTLRDTNITGGKLCAFIAGVNLGTIENVVIEPDCTMFVRFKSGAATAAYNGGTIRNVVCYPAEYTTPTDSESIMASCDGLETKNVYIADRNDRTAKLGKNWEYIEGYGNVYCNEYYKKIVSVPQEMFKTQNAEFKIYQNSIEQLEFITDIGNIERPGILELVSADKYTYTLKLKDEASLLMPGSSFRLRVRIKDGDYIDGEYNIVMGEPYIVSVQYTGEPIRSILGADLLLSGINLSATMSDGSHNNALHPIRYEGYNKTGAAGVAQDVKLFYGAGADDFVTVKVTPEESTEDVALDITAVKKTSGRVTYDMGGTLDFDEFFTFTVRYSKSGNKTVLASDAKMSIGSYSSGHVSVHFAYTDGAIASADIDMDIWCVINTAADWDSMNGNLSGYYMLAQGAAAFDLGGASYRIGSVPTKVVGDSTVIDEGDTAETMAFNGKFDGNGRTIKNWTVSFEEYDSWYGGAYFAYGMFAYIGTGAEVGNFTLDNCTMQGFSSLDIVSCYNRGTIYEVTVNDNCKIDTKFSEVGAFAVVNRGVVVDCTNNGATYTFMKPDPSGSATLPDVSSGNAPTSTSD